MKYVLMLAAISAMTLRDAGFSALASTCSKYEVMMSSIEGSAGNLATYTQKKEKRFDRDNEQLPKPKLQSCSHLLVL
jgi:hypothetical protein